MSLFFANQELKVSIIIGVWLQDLPKDWSKESSGTTGEDVFCVRA
jgi:hypothetical protein